MLFFQFFSFNSFDFKEKEVFYLSANLPYEKKIELLERQIETISLLVFQPGYLDRLSLFKSHSKRIFTMIFPDPNEYIKKLDDINFQSSSFEFDEPLHPIAEEDYFYSGRNDALILLIDAIEDVKLEKEVEFFNPKQVSNTEDTTKVFIVHGHDDALKNEVARFIEQQGLKAIILHEQVSRGNTIIEKIEANSDVGFAIVLYTPCDIGRSLKSEEDHPRARQNVIFEHGYFVAKLGRQNVVALNKGSVEIPNDLSGVVYTSYDEYGAWKKSIAHELNDSGYKIDFSKV